MHVVWSIQQMQLGRLLPHDCWGEPLKGFEPGSAVIADGWRAMWTGMKGDQAFLKKAFQLKGRSWVSRKVCFTCEARGWLI